jgi:hypothetical protein
MIKGIPIEQIVGNSSEPPTWKPGERVLTGKGGMRGKHSLPELCPHFFGKGKLISPSSELSFHCMSYLDAV